MILDKYLGRTYIDGMAKVCISCKLTPQNVRWTRGYCQNCYARLRSHKLLENLPVFSVPALLSKEQQEILDGSMLGDGSLCLPKRGINARFMVRRQTADRSYLLWEYEHLKDFVVSSPSDESRFDNRTNKTYHIQHHPMSFEVGRTRPSVND